MPFDDFFEEEQASASGWAVHRGRKFKPIRTEHWIPPIDIYEKAMSVVVITELPGVDKNDISVTFEEGSLTISGIKRKEKIAFGGSFFRVERYCGAFTRTLRILPCVNAGKMHISFDAGILTVVIPKVKK